eukprot:TRINITY_DN8252_c0_g1_i1.p1 TRINITY_DN8252_c0_g1~~TRINITY_DN8252_c0_g1_i1.p1  ORF type:complete len:223 (-),score=64.42 TRINITY_DN8252_c0_g1_i1:491-1159(-)
MLYLSRKHLMLCVGDEEGMIQQSAKELIDALLTIDPNKRIGTRSVEDIKKHKFFEGINWTNIRKLPAPYVPAAEDIMDTSNFEKERKIEEAESKNPFFGLSNGNQKGSDIIKEAKKMLSSDMHDLKMTRLDLLDEYNQISAEEANLQKQALIKKKEEELAKILEETGESVAEDDILENANEYKLRFLRKNSIFDAPFLLESQAYKWMHRKSVRNLLKKTDEK